MNIKKQKLGTLLCHLGNRARGDLQQDTATLCSDVQGQSEEEEVGVLHPETTAKDKLLQEVSNNQHSGIQIHN